MRPIRSSNEKKLYVQNSHWFHQKDKSKPSPSARRNSMSGGSPSSLTDTDIDLVTRRGQQSRRNKLIKVSMPKMPWDK